MLDGIDDQGLGAAAAVRAEWRAEEEQWTRAALEQWEHDQTLLDVLRSCMHRGDTVAVAFTVRVFTGVVTAVGQDVARIETADGSVDAHLGVTAACTLRVVTTARAGGDRGDRSVATFRARLLHLEGGAVELGVSGGERCARREAASGA